MTLTIKNLSLRFPYKEKLSLQNINLKINHKETIGLLGKNGAGKSTLLRVIAGIYSPDSGHIVCSKRVYSIFNFNSGLDSELTGYQNLYRMGILRQIDKKTIDKNINKLIEFTELEKKIHDPAYTYSNGMKIRIGIALLLIKSPKIIIFDEGLGAGDLSYIKKIKKLINYKIKNSAISIISSHSLSIIKELTNRVIIIDEGKIIYDGLTEDAIEFYRAMK